MDISFTNLITVAAIGPLLYLIYKSISKSKNYPPGPMGIPIIGSLHYLKQYTEQDMLKLATTYGNIFSLSLFTQNYVCVCDVEANNEVLLNTDICDRSAAYIFHMIKGSNYGEFLKSFHALTRSVFMSNKYVKNNADHIVQKETTDMMHELEDLFQSNQPQYIRKTVETFYMNVSILTLVGEKNVTTTKEAKVKTDDLFQSILQLFELMESPLFILPDMIPWLEKIWLPESATKFISTSEKIFSYFSDQIELHKNTIDPTSPRDLIDLYLIEMQNQELFTDAGLRAALYDMLFAGTVNSARTLEYAALYLAANQNVQARILTEIQEVIDDDEIKNFDGLKMPYTYATVHEILRVSNATPVGVPRVATRDVTVGGYSIPKGTIFLLNSYSSHMQEDKWKNPKHFDPENFLSGVTGDIRLPITSKSKVSQKCHPHLSFSQDTCSKCVPLF
ncbi:cytochrome P450 2J6-like [Styela clava]